MLAAQTPQQLIDSLKNSLRGTQSEAQYIKACFTIADNFMEVDQYDSAQQWLNRIAEILPLKTPSLENYFLSSRQSEVYYYNGLQRLGLQEAQRSHSIATALKDSLLLADSYNFMGLFYVNLDSTKQAIEAFMKGLHYSKKGPLSQRYLSMSAPYHLAGNLAEAFQKAGRCDSALIFAEQSLQLARKAGSSRAVSVAQELMGNCYLAKYQTDKAISLFTEARSLAIQSGDFDVELLCYKGIAQAAHLQDKREDVMKALQMGFTLMEQKPVVNNLFLGKFLDGAIDLYRIYDEGAALSRTLQLKATLLEAQLANNNQQVNVILNAGLKNETRLLQLQVNEERQRNEINNTRIYLLALLLVLLLAAFLFYRHRSRQQLQLVRLQHKISQDLHDDVGSSLSSLHVYSTVADSLIEQDPQKAREMLRRISKESTQVMENIGDIVWSMKTDREQSMEERIKNFAADVLGAAGIGFRITVDEGFEAAVRSIEGRRNVLLIVKEAVNNAVKYSRAGHINIQLRRSAGGLQVVIGDDGIGFTTEGGHRKGDGLSNMQKRTLELGGSFEIMSSPGKGTTVAASIPLTKFSDPQ